MVSTTGFDAGPGADFVRYAHMVAWRGHVHTTLGNMIRLRSRT